MENIFIGCDVSKAKIDFCILGSNKNDSYYGQFKNDEEGYHQFLSTVAITNPFKNPLVGFEATGSFTYSFQKYLSDNGINHHMFNARRVSKYAKSMIVQGKTDKSDSYVIAHFCSIQDVSVFVSSYSIDKESFTKYTTTLRMYQKIKTQIGNLSKSTGNGVLDVELQLDLLKTKKDLENREKNIKNRAVEMLKLLYPVSIELEEKYQGVGYALLLNLVPKIYDTIENFTNNQTVAFLGYNPVSFQSGLMNAGDKLNMFGDKEFKRLLYLSALTSTRFNPILQTKYQSLLERGKAKKLSLTIIARKLLVALVQDMKRYKKQNK